MMTVNSKIVPHLWYDKEAKEAAEYYVSIFPNSRLTSLTTISDTPSGDVDIVTFDLMGVSFMAISAGPMFKINESISFYVYCGSDAEIENLYKKLSDKGTSLMPLDKYPWSNKYAWVKDKFGLSWQLDVANIDSSQKILPSILFANEKFKQVKEAVTFYNSIFPDSKVLLESPYDKSANLPDDILLFAQFSLSGYLFNSMSSNIHHDFDFNEAISFMVYCENQKEIDYYWEKLTDRGQEQPCGWVKDRFGVSWQVVPREMDEMMQTKDKEQLDRVTQAMLKMMKFDLEVLRKAYNNS